jgi:CHASE1-domain containing sensor protein
LRGLFQASDEVNRSEFWTFADTILRDQSAILTVSWIPRIPHAERAAHELAGVRAGLPGYRINSMSPDGKLTPSPEHSEYFPVF